MRKDKTVVEVGTYKLGKRNVRLMVEAERGGGASARIGPVDGGADIITLYVLGVSWGEVVGALLHEAMEIMLHEGGCGYVCTGMLRETTSGYMFVARHDVFDNCCTGSGLLLGACEKELRKAWGEINVAKPRRRV